MLLDQYRAAIAQGELRADPAQENAARKLGALAQLLATKRGFSLFGRKAAPPKGLYIWGDVGRGKTLLMDLFFEEVPMEKKRRVHFNGFMVDVHARIHAERQRAEAAIPFRWWRAPWPKRRGFFALTNSRSPMWPTP